MSGETYSRWHRKPRQCEPIVGTPVRHPGHAKSGVEFRRCDCLISHRTAYKQR